MINLIYYSTAVTMYSIQDLILLEKQCVEGNESRGITGILLYNKGCIMQILEGETSDVNCIFNRIKKDKRHTDVYEINSYEISNRNYTEWSMQFKIISDQNWCKVKDFVKVNNMDGGIYPIRTPMNLRLISLISTFVNIDITHR